MFNSLTLSPQPWRILLVDDDPGMLQLWSTVLRGLRFRDRHLECLGAQDLAQAREVIAQHSDIAITLLDAAMPDAGSGLDLVRHVRVDLRNRLMRIIVATGHGQQAHELCTLTDWEVNACIDKGATDSVRLCGTVLGLLRAYEELAQMSSALRRVSRLAMTDGLTGLRNRMALHSAFRSSIQDARARTASMALVFIDLDDFKSINDREGHLRGDEVLRCVAAAILSASREQDEAFRYGGDEFVVVLADCTSDEARSHYLPRLDKSLRQMGVRASCGVSELLPPDYLPLDAALKAADSDMYRLKQRRRRRPAHSTPVAPAVLAAGPQPG